MWIEFFVKRPIFAAVCSVLIIMAGLVCLPLLPIGEFPQIAAPQVTVTTNYIGANAQVVESAVTTPLEQELNGIPGLRYMTSTSSNDGTSTVTLTFNRERNLDAAMVDVQNRVQTAQARLPAEVKATGINIAKNSSSIVLVYGLYSDKGRYDNYFISNYTDRYIKDNLKRVRGVGNVTIFGERKYAMRLWLDPDKLAARNLTAGDVVDALREQNVQVAAGQIGQQPIAEEQAFQMSIRATGRLTSAESFDELVIKRGPGGALVLLKDVGRAELGAENYSSTLRFNGQDAVGLGIFQLPDANALEVASNVKARMAELSKSFPPGLRYQLAIDTTTTVYESIRDVLFTLAVAILLVVGVIYVFLQSWRSTLIPAITIPVSLIGTLAFLKLFGFSINTLTLFGLTLATGLVVDDAIVVIENIERYIQEKGMHPARAAIEGMREVFSAVVATSLVLIAVFVPVAFFPGTTGELYKQFALTIAFSIALSAFNALTLTPALSALILSAQTHGTAGFFRKVNELIHGLRSLYHRALTLSVKAWGAVMLLFVLSLGATWFLFRTVPQGFVPNEDRGYFIITVQSPEGSSLNYTHNIIRQVEANFRRIPEIAGSFAVGGFSFTGNGPNKAMLFVALHPIEERRGAGQSTSAVVNQLRGPLLGIPGALVFPFEPPSIQGVGNFGGFQFEIKDEGNHDIGTLFNTTQAVIGQGMQTPVLTGLFSSFTANDPQLLVDIDRLKAKALGVNLRDVFDTLQVFLGSAYVNDFDYLNRIYRVYVQADQAFRGNPNQIGRFYVRSEDDRMVPISNLATVKQVYAPQIINHYNMFRSTEINGSAKPGYSTGQAIDAMESVARKTLPEGMTFEWSGIALEEQESGQQALFIFGLSFIIVFLVLAAQYESLTEPLIIILSVPMAILGALLAQYLAGLQNDVFCQIGLVMLIGLASKNAILIVEFANQLRAEGRSITQAAIEAAQTRFRPILMTSLAFILGIFPLVIASGAGAGARRSMGTAVFGGMIVSTVLNLFIVPVLYILVAKLTERHHCPKPAEEG